MPHPLLYEINTRCWLGELSAQAGQSLDLPRVPDAEFQKWQRLGFTHIWLMGIWQAGRHARRHALSQARGGRYETALPGCCAEDVEGSPYAVAEYTVSGAVGGESGLQAFRIKLESHGIKLILDFVPNHLGLDHPWLRTNPERFVQSRSPCPETFRIRTANGFRWVAKGKDPHFPAWSDTAQLEYRRGETRQAMIEQLQRISGLCDGVRCDMAMLLLNEVFVATWKDFPIDEPLPETEYWSETISTIKRSRPDFMFLAEVYWGFEERLQELGFDYTYDKRLYDHLIARNTGAVQELLMQKSPAMLAKSINFLENHDEPRIASMLSLPELRAAAWLVLSLPGMCLIHDGQLTGARFHCPVQLGRRQKEPVQGDIVRLHEQLLEAVQTGFVRKGQAVLLPPPLMQYADCGRAETVIAVLWRDENHRNSSFDISIVNLAGRCRFQLFLPIAELPRHHWQMAGVFDGSTRSCPGHELSQNGLELELPDHGAELLRFEHVQS
jgi:hypothetical protein